MTGITRAPFGLRRAASLAAMSLAIVVATAPSAAASEPGLGAEGTATLDGALGPREWDSAPSATFPVNLPGGASVTGEIRAMNDPDNLYLLFRLPTSWAGSYLGFSLPFEFDNDNDDSGMEEGDDVFVVNAFWYPWSTSPDIGVFDDYRTMLPPCPGEFFCGSWIRREEGRTTCLLPRRAPAAM